MVAELTSIAGRLDWTVWHGREETALLNWPAGYLAGHGPWTATVTATGHNPVTPSVTVDGDVMTITIAQGATAPLLHVLARFTLADDGRLILAGTLFTSDNPGPSSVLEQTIVIEEQTVTVELAGGTTEAPVQSVNGQTGAVDLDAGDVEADPVGSAAAVAANLTTHEADDTAHGDPLAAVATVADNLGATDDRVGVLEAAEAQVAWKNTGVWGRFTQVPITNIIGTTNLGVEAGGIGTATSSNEHGSDRQIYTLDGFQASDMEVRVEFSINSSAAQVGLGMRVGETAPGFMGGVMPWSNVFFGANANVIPGVWEWDGVEFLNTNQQSGVLTSRTQRIISAVGDGATVTVKTVSPHSLSQVQGSGTKMTFGPFSDTNFVATPVDATTFVFASTEVFSATSGTWDQNSTILPTSIRRGFAARVVGDQVTYKHWFPDVEPEPGWADPLRSFTYTVPASLASGRSLPASGGAGLMFGHLGNTGRVISVNDYQARSLDPPGGP